jgi:hypothetical protein
LHECCAEKDFPFAAQSDVTERETYGSCVVDQTQGQFMSELIVARQHGNYRHLLLGGASAIAMLVVTAAPALADDENHFYIELGGQYGIESGGSTDWFALPAAGGEGAYTGVGPDTFKIHSKNSWNIDGDVKFQPAGSDLILRLGVQYGRTRSEHKDAAFTYLTSTDGGRYYYITAHARNKEEHVKVDFQVGKDFGLGMFGNNSGTSIFSVGIRYAQFNSRSDALLNFTTGTKYATGSGTSVVSRSFHGIGPMISWEASAPISDEGFSLDWGAEAAVLFGRQKLRFEVAYTTGYSTGGERHRNKTVPEVGGFMGISWNCPDAKFSLGYKVDAMFNVLDGGLITGGNVDRITHGPFVKVGVNVN